MDHLAAASPRPQGDSTKLRKIRKGANSCWECKWRKVRCTSDSASDHVCMNCRRRGTACLSQEFPEAAAPSGDRDLPPRGEEGNTLQPLADVPTIPPSQNSSRREESYFAMEGINFENGDLVAGNTRPQQQCTDTAKHAKISQALYSTLPSPEDIEIMWKASAHVSIYFYQVLARPGFNNHPVLLAKYIFFIATVLWYIDPESYETIETMPELPQVMANRLVTAHDELLGTMEGLECIMMERMYQANCGNLRRSWVSFRRAMALAQLMGLHRAGKQKLKSVVPRARINPPYLWYHIDMEIGRLERLHCTITSRILERNDANPESYSFDITQKVDSDLQNVAETMPSGW
ncbi:hypothetical protein P170DRAFT_468276 [Aspergillus steynii IBT 23096]|uniref:Zn(2)-C6 fungal-type domain-containing protein n=1 Tax=Aspergillus steynii IBT 23096 TaxID=1392250 RepID=A0A2I2FVG4_9EURO|nr:uncharacterized protein P170DRAFT_468276 [Aspergillus steynii IBT 23096]PLB44638.1 hypothetical protein P170DRAFT_468276 [Aspergillus steynii IBT 23096]